MATQAATLGPTHAAETGLFLRKATGLVRELSVVDAIVMNSTGMNIGVGGALLFIWAPYLLTGGNLLLSIVICTVLVACTTAYTYAVSAGAFPRSGSDYVFTSRVLGPVWGFLYSIQWVIWEFFWMAFNARALAYFALPSVLTLLGVVTGNPGLVDLAGQASTATFAVIAAVILQVLFAALAIMGLKPMFRYLKISMVFMVLSIVLAAVLLVLNGSHFVDSWNTFVAASGKGIPYDQVISKAAELGFVADKPFDFGQTLGMMPLIFWSIGFFAGSQIMAGEVRQARSSQFISMVIGVVLNGAVLLVLAYLVQVYMGGKFLSSLGFLTFEHADALNLPVQANVNFTVSILTQNVPIIGLIGLGYIFWALNGTPIGMNSLPRYLLAFSFDRMAPQWLGEVSEKYHTPVKAIIFSAFMGMVAIVVLIIWQQASLLSSMMAQMWYYALLAVAAIVFPYKFPELWKATTSGRKILGIPLITLAGIGALVFIAVMSYYFAFYSMFGANSAISLSAVAITVVAGAIYYYGYRAYQKRHGINIDLVYKELPPE